MNEKRIEAFWGYLFALPAILLVCVFLLYPIALGFYYSFTSYSPLDASRFRATLNMQEELEVNRGIAPAGIADPEEAAAGFDMADFLAGDLQVKLTDAELALVRGRFQTARFFQDLKAGKLDRSLELTTILSTYMDATPPSFHRYRPALVGLENFARMLKDEYFWLALGNTVEFAVIVVAIQTMLALVLAVSAGSGMKGVGAFKLIFFLPSITSSAAISMIFWLLYSRPGIFNRLLGGVGIPPVDWLNEPRTALFAVMLMNIWTTAGYFMVTFLAGMKQIPADIYESARMDGASPLRTLVRITFPMLRPQVLYVVTMGTIGCLQVFDQIYFLIQNMRNFTIAFYIYKNAFSYGKMGYASAIAVVLFLIIVVVTTIQKRVIRESATS